MITVFERIPVFFVEMYDAQFQQWARELRTRGYHQAIPFFVPPGKPVRWREDGFPETLNEEGEWIARGCWLEAHYDAGLTAGAGLEPKMVIRPRTDADAELIERHCREMARYRLQ